jgi:DNA polymerase III delta prime subunit
MPEQIRSRLEYIIQEEGVSASEPGKEALMQLAGGDMRRVINGLQSTHMAFGVVDEDTVYKCCGQPTRKEMSELWSILTDDEDVKSNIQSQYLSPNPFLFLISHESGSQEFWRFRQ